jgi:hypothetical protein
MAYGTRQSFLPLLSDDHEVRTLQASTDAPESRPLLLLSEDAGHQDCARLGRNCSPFLGEYSLRNALGDRPR